MPVQPHRFEQYLEGRGMDAAWWEECSLDGAASKEEPRSYPWVSVRLGGHGIRRVSRALRSPLKWAVRLIFLSPVLILLRAALARTNPLASDAVTVAFVALIVGFFALLCVYIALLATSYALSSRRPSVEPPTDVADADQGGISLGGLKLPAAALPLADQRITIHGRVASIGDTLPGGDGVVVRDRWVTGAAVPRREVEAVDFAVIAEGQPPAVVRLESAPLLVARPDAQGGDNEGELFTLRTGQEVELVGVPDGEIVDVANFELGGRVRSLVPDEHKPATPYRSDAARPATRVLATAVAARE